MIKLDLIKSFSVYLLFIIALLSSKITFAKEPIDFIKDETKTVRFFALRSFGESLYESLTDACLEYGYITK